MNGYDFTYPVTYTVTALDGTTAQYRVTVIPGGRLTSLSAVPLQTEYAYGEALDLEKIVVTGYYAATGISQRELIEADDLSGYDADKSGSQRVLVTLNGQTAAFTVTVKAKSSAKDIISFVINGKSGFINANRQISVDIDGDAEVTALKPAITVSEGATVSPASGAAFDFTNPVTYTVTALDGTESQYKVTVIPGVRLTSLSVTPLQTEYAYGDALDLDKIVVTGTYSGGGASKRETITTNNLSGYDAEKSGSQQVLVTLNGVTATFTVTVGVKPGSLDLAVGLPNGGEVPFSVTSGSSAVDLSRPIQISAHGVDGKPREIVISTSSQYSSHAWYKDGKKIDAADGAVYTIKAADNYIYGKEYSVTFVGTIGTAPTGNQPDYRIRYSKDIRFTVAY